MILCRQPGVPASTAHVGKKGYRLSKCKPLYLSLPCMQVWMALASIVLTVHVDHVCCVVRFTTEPTVIPAAGETRFTVGKNHYEGQQQQKENQFDGVTIF